MNTVKITELLLEFAQLALTVTPEPGVWQAHAKRKLAIAGEFADVANDAAKWEAAVPLLQRLANEAWMRLDYKLNAEICALLGEPSAIEHEGGGDAP